MSDNSVFFKPSLKPAGATGSDVTTLHPSFDTTGKSGIKRIAELDGLRGIAILLVLSFHYINNQLVHSDSMPGKLLSRLTMFGWVGVDLFFVLSGFLIGSILIANRTSKKYFSTFFIRRVARIIPNYFLLVGLFLLILSIPAFSNNYFLTGNQVLPLWSYFLIIQNFYMAAVDSLGNTAMSVTWSIGIEEQFYILFPFVVYFLKKKWLPYFLVLVIIAASVIRLQYDTWVPTYVLLGSRMDALAFGVLIAYYYQKLNFIQFVQTYKVIFLGLLGLNVLICAALYYWLGDLGPIKHTLFSFIFSILVVFALGLKNTWYSRLLTNRTLMWVGTLSYSLYLFNYMFLGVFHHFAGNTNGIGIETSQDVLVTVLAALFTFAFSWFIYKFLEAPMVAWGKKFRY